MSKPDLSNDTRINKFYLFIFQKRFSISDLVYGLLFIIIVEAATRWIV